MPADTKIERCTAIAWRSCSMFVARCGDRALCSNTLADERIDAALFGAKRARDEKSLHLSRGVAQTESTSP